MKYTWNPAVGTDSEHIVKMAQNHFECEIDNIFKPEPVVYSRNVTLAIVNQFYNPLSVLISVAKDEQNNLLAYTWAARNEHAPWSDDEMIVIRMAHVDLSVSPRLRVQLITDMIHIWEAWANLCKVPIICSTTMRNDQQAFLKLHERNGYDVRGSYAYKKLSA